MRFQSLSRVAAGVAVLSVAACATPHPGSIAQAERDPWEKTNRKVYALNRGLDRYALKPASNAYRAVVPGAARRGISNGLNNITEPTSFINAVLQGKIKQAFRTVDRFLINSTIGIAGLADQATNLGRPEEPEDFGQTLAVWGVKSGPYLMLPFFGPSTLRDAVGLAGDFAADPVPYARKDALGSSIFVSGGQFGLTALDLRSKLTDAGADNVLDSSLDEYATVKSAYLQRRQSQIYDGSPPDDDDAPVEDAPLAPGATPPGAASSPATDSPPKAPSPAVPQPVTPPAAAPQ